MAGEAGVVVVSAVPTGGALDGGPPALVIEATQDSPAPVTLTPQEASERSLELFTGAGVDDWVDAAVKVAQPEDHLKHGVRRLQGWEERAYREMEREIVC